MRLILPVSVLACVAACRGDAPDTTDTAATTADTTTTETSSTTTGDVPTTSATTGEAELGGARVVYSTRKPGGIGNHELFFVDCTADAPGPAIRIHEPLADGWSVSHWMGFSSSARWMHYTLEHPTMGQEVWLVDMSGPLPGVPKKAEIPPDLPPHFVPLGFSHDETKLALGLMEPGGVQEIYLCTLEPDGGCVPESWGVPLAPGGRHELLVLFSPDDTRIAYIGDPEGDDVWDVFLGATAPGDAGKAVLVSDVPPTSTVDEMWFSPDGSTLYYAFGLNAGQAGVRAIDITSDPPGLPKAIIPKGGRYRFRADSSAVLRWDDLAEDGNGGDLTFFGLDGTKVSPGLPIHDEPNRVSFLQFQWSSDDRFALYLAASESTTKAWEVYAVDTSGPTPAPPVKVSAPLAANGKLSSLRVGPDPSYLMYFASSTSEADDELWMASLDPPGEPVMVDVPLPPTRVLNGETIFNADGSRFLYTAVPGPEGQLELFLADRAAPDASFKVNAPLDPDEIVSSPAFSQDGGRVFYWALRRIDDDGTEARALMVDLDAPGTALPVNDPAHNVATLTVLPPSSQ